MAKRFFALLPKVGIDNESIDYISTERIGAKRISIDRAPALPSSRKSPSITSQHLSYRQRAMRDALIAATQDTFRYHIGRSRVRAGQLWDVRP